MKKLFSIIFVIGLLWCNVSVAETIESFKCTPKKTSKKHQAKNDLNFMLVSTKSKTQKFVNYNIEDNTALARVYNEEFLKSRGIDDYTSYTEWATFEYNFWDYFPEQYTVTGYMLTERKDGKLLLAGTVLILGHTLATSEYYYEEFLESQKKRNTHKNNDEKYLEMSLKDSTRIGDHHAYRWNDTNDSERALIAWNCKKA